LTIVLAALAISRRIQRWDLVDPADEHVALHQQRHLGTECLFRHAV